MKKIVIIEDHALVRLHERAELFGLSPEEAKERVLLTAKFGTLTKRKHISEHHETYQLYFKDNLTFYVICQEKIFAYYILSAIKTVIIEKGRT